MAAPIALSKAVVDVPTTSGDALRLATKLAVDAGEYERAAALLDVLRRTTSACAVTPIGAARAREATPCRE